jgi:hypothetical protein
VTCAGVARLVAILIGLLALVRWPAFAQDPSARITVPVLPSPPTLGTVDESWTGAAKVGLDIDFNYRRPAGEETVVSIAQDSRALDIAFVVRQTEAVTAATETNGPAVLGDDYVGIYAFPQGAQGFAYSFFANARGARYQTSSENSSYNPHWQAGGTISQAGYVVTLRVPFDIIRSAGSTSWNVQLVRSTSLTNALSVWTFSDLESNPADPAFAGSLLGIGSHAEARALRAKPRAQFYTLGEAEPRWAGGNTSRVGADFALPVTPTASFLATLHPDFSNVEIDQQTISPTPFTRQVGEVRPFLTQVGSAFNYFTGCNSCPQTLYTPAIPSFRDGFAIEGSQGKLTFGAFDAVGSARSDSAQALNYNTANQSAAYGLNLQRVAVTVSGLGELHDVATTLTGGYQNQRSHLLLYLDYGLDRGSRVAESREGDYVQTGAGFAGPTSSALVIYQHIGSQFAPVDGYVQQNDVRGFSELLSKSWAFSPRSQVQDTSVSTFSSNFVDRFGHPAQRDANTQLNLELRNRFSLHVFASSLQLRTQSGEFLPFDSNGISLGYHTSSSLPSLASYSTGVYYHGRLNSWTYLTTVPVRRRVHLNLEADENAYWSSALGESHVVQWLERASVNWQIARDASIDFGARRVLGGGLPNAYEPPDSTSFNAGNVSFAFHILQARNELYAGYGDPNSASTTPVLYIKWTHYIGASKGT